MKSRTLNTIAGGLGLCLLLGLAACATTSNREIVSEETEQSVALADLPPAVRAAAAGAVEGIVLEEAEVEIENGVKVYEVEGEANGKEYEIEIDATGKVLEVEEDLDEDEDDD